MEDNGAKEVKAQDVKPETQEVKAQDVKPETQDVKPKNLREALEIADKKLREKPHNADYPVKPSEAVKQSPEPLNNAPVQPAETEKIEPLKYWAQDEKDFFNTLDAAGKHKVLNMFKNIQSVYDRRTQELKKTEKEYEDIRDLLADSGQYLEQNKMTRAQYINALIEADRLIQADPAAFIFNVMAHRGINFEMLRNGLQRHMQRQADPVYNQLRTAQLQSRQIKAQNERMRAQELSAKLESFLNEADEKGNKKHPFFEELKGTMAQLSQQTGTMDLKELYEKALWLTPEVRQKVIDEQLKRQMQEEQELQRKTQQEEKVKKAASVDVKSSLAMGKDKAVKKSLDDIIKEEAQRLNN
jgi:hypothetical protein